MPFTNVQGKPNRDGIKYRVLSIKQFIHNTKHRKSTGFTLIELLIVISIIGILITIGLYSFDNARQKGRDSRRKQDLSAIKSALVLYYQDNKKFPGTAGQSYASNTSNSWIPDLTPTYIQKLPNDPLQSVTGGGNCTNKTNIYCYNLNADGTFELWAQLENSNNQEIFNKPNAKCNTTPPSNTQLNYCLASPAF